MGTDTVPNSDGGRNWFRRHNAVAGAGLAPATSRLCVLTTTFAALVLLHSVCSLDYTFSLSIKYGIRDLPSSLYTSPSLSKISKKVPGLARYYHSYRKTSPNLTDYPLTITRERAHSEPCELLLLHPAERSI